MSPSQGFTEMSSDNRITVVFISGFLTPKDWKSYPEDLISANVNLIPVYPSPAGSLHDRACQIFYELFGGVIDYGEEHSCYHNHERFGRHYKKGKLSVWNKDNPIIIIGHSLGGCTAWVLQNYLAQRRFPGIDTSADWISGIVCVNSPLNGALQVHGKGMDLCHPPVVRWGSVGCIIGWVAQWSEYLDCAIVKDHMDFQQEHWKLTRNDAGAFEKLLLSLLGYCLHSGTDNVAYDVTIQSQIEWAKTLRSFPSSHYISVVGKLETAEVNSWRAYELVGLAYRTATNLLRSEAPPRICGVDTSSWMHTGSDGLLTVYTQEYPRLFTTAAANSTTTVDSVCSGECNQRPNSCQMCLPSQSRSKNTKATAGAWPTHIGRQFSSTELYAESVQLERGVWHYTHRNISHLNAGLGCKETWGFLMQAVQVLAHSRNQQRLSVSPTSAPTVTVINGSVTTTMSGTGRKKSKSHRSCSSKDLPRIDRTLAVGTGGKPISTSPDMQSAAHLHLPCHHTSTAMAFRWSNLIFAAILASIIAVPHLYAFFLDRSDGMVISSSISLPSGLFILLCAGLFCSALFFLVALKPSPPSDASYFYFPNDSYLLAETAEIAYAMYRVACVSDMYFGAMLSSAPAWLFTAGSMSSTSILCEMLLLSLLPRPLFDFKNQPAAVLLGILLNFYPAPWIAAVRRGGNVLFLALGLECLAKLPWLVIYCTRREDNKSSGALLRRYCTLSSMLLYIACWGWFVCELWTLNNSFQSSVASAVDTTSVDGGGGMYTTFCVIFVLWAAYPLSKFQDLSECVQYVMIERYHY